MQLFSTLLNIVALFVCRAISLTAHEVPHRCELSPENHHGSEVSVSYDDNRWYGTGIYEFDNGNYYAGFAPLGTTPNSPVVAV